MNSQSYAVGWGTLALINANIAQLKGQSAAIAFVGSLFVGPIVTLILAIKSPKPPSGAAAE